MKNTKNRKAQVKKTVFTTSLGVTHCTSSTIFSPAIRGSITNPAIASLE